MFWRGSAPDPAGGAYNAPPDFLAGSQGPLCGGKGKGWEGKGLEREGDKKGGKG